MHDLGDCVRARGGGVVVLGILPTFLTRGTRAGPQRVGELRESAYEDLSALGRIIRRLSGPDLNGPKDLE